MQKWFRHQFLKLSKLTTTNWDDFLNQRKVLAEALKNVAVNHPTTADVIKLGLSDDNFLDPKGHRGVPVQSRPFSVEKIRSQRGGNE